MAASVEQPLFLPNVDRWLALVPYAFWRNVAFANPDSKAFPCYFLIKYKPTIE